MKDTDQHSSNEQHMTNLLRAGKMTGQLIGYNVAITRQDALQINSLKGGEIEVISYTLNNQSIQFR